MVHGFEGKIGVMVAGCQEGPGVPRTGTHPVCPSHFGKSGLHSHSYPVCHEERGHAGGGTIHPV